jgi:hypothetical protein
MTGFKTVIFCFVKAGLFRQRLSGGQGEKAMYYDVPLDHINPCRLPEQMAAMANSLYHSLQGQYFVGYADNMFFESDKNAWASLANPVNSGVNLFVNVWTVTDLFEPPIGIQMWFNATMPGDPTQSRLVTPANTAIRPLPEPKIKLLQASNVVGEPVGGIKGFARRTVPGETVVDEEDGKFIIPPGGNFAIFLSDAGETDVPASVRVAYGWWEEKVCGYKTEKKNSAGLKSFPL